MTYSNIIALIHNIICFLCSFFILYTSANLLFKKPQKNFQVTRTPVVLLYFWFTASSSILTICSAVYFFIWWQSEVFAYHPMILYYIAGIPTIYINFVPIADFYLCADRCLSVAFPFRYRKTFKAIVAVMFVSTIAGVWLSYILATRYFAFYTPDATTTCAYYICLVVKLRYPLIITYTKYAFCGLKVGAAAILIALINFRKSSQKDLLNKLNRSVLFISFTNIIFSFIPGLATDLVAKVSWLSWLGLRYQPGLNRKSVGITIITPPMT